MKYNITNMNTDILKEIISWKYEDEYSIYNMDSYEKLVERNSSIIKEENKNNYFCYFNNNILIAYTKLVMKKNGDVFLGIGIAPIYCGKGLGKDILSHTIRVAKERYPNSKITLQVRSWNERAIKCYPKVGFKVTGKETIKDHNGILAEFVFMEYKI